MKDFAPYSPYVDGITHGADYFPEQWLDREDILEEDIKLMHEANCNIVSIGMFAWAFLEPSEGVFEFGWLHKVLDRLNEAGIKVWLATPSASPPRWLSNKYDDTRIVNELGHRRKTGERQCSSLSSEIFREKVAEINKRLAKEFSSHPAVIGWHISNEYGPWDYSEKTVSMFRDYLRDYFDNDIEKLNKSWWTAFWSRRYASFDEIDAPSSNGDNSLHGLTIAWQRFQSFLNLDFFKFEIACIREAETRHLPVTTNFHIFRQMEYGFDYTEFAEAEDVVSWDDYPEFYKHPNEPWKEAAGSAFIHNYCRSVKDGKPFVLMECSPSATNWQEFCRLRPPGLQELMNLFALAHGADSIQYFQWRKSLGSSEKFHGAVVDHGGSDTRVFREIASTGKMLKVLSKSGVTGARTKAEVAIVMDFCNAFAFKNIQALSRNKPRFFDMFKDLQECLYSFGVMTDIVDRHSSSEKLSQYKLIIAPLLYAVDENFANNLITYVKNGGTLLAGPFSFIANLDDHVYQMKRPGLLRDCFGVYIEETETLLPGERVSIKLADVLLSRTDSESDIYTENFFDLMHLENACSLAEFNDSWYKAYPALSKNNFADGRAYYLAAFPNLSILSEVIKFILDEAGVNCLSEKLNDGCFVIRRENAEKKFVFYFNFTNENQMIVNKSALSCIDCDFVIPPETGVKMKPMSVRFFVEN